MTSHSTAQFREPIDGATTGPANGPHAGADTDNPGAVALGEQQFMSMLTREVIPRLVLLEEESDAITRLPVGSLQNIAAEIAEAAVHEDLGSCQSRIRALLRQGYPVDRILLEVIQPAARHLGQGWYEDSCNFADVTLGMWNLQQLFSDLLERFGPAQSGFVVPDTLPPSVLFCTLPGCHHRLGVQMVAAFFTRAGWTTRLAQGESEQSLLAQISAFVPDLVGLSVSSERDLRLAPGLVKHIRNRAFSEGDHSPLIMLGGPAVALFPELAAQAGADFHAGDAPEALEAAYTHISKDADCGPR